MEFINATPHTVNVFNLEDADRINMIAKEISSLDLSVAEKDGEFKQRTANISPVASFLPSGIVARAMQTREPVTSIPYFGTSFPVGCSTFGTLEGLPEPQEGVIYIVSALALSASVGRNDLLVPAVPVRDHAGRVIGCQQFDTNASPSIEGVSKMFVTENPVDAGVVASAVLYANAQATIQYALANGAPVSDPFDAQAVIVTVASSDC